jgi:hypothetical protein
MTLLFRDRPATLSERETIIPGTIIRMTGIMSQCDKCRQPYRRMATDPDTPWLCGRCYPTGGPKEG